MGISAAQARHLGILARGSKILDLKEENLNQNKQNQAETKKEEFFVFDENTSGLAARQKAEENYAKASINLHYGLSEEDQKAKEKYDKIQAKLQEQDKKLEAESNKLENARDSKLNDVKNGKYKSVKTVANSNGNVTYKYTLNDGSTFVMTHLYNKPSATKTAAKTTTKQTTAKTSTKQTTAKTTTKQTTAKTTAEQTTAKTLDEIETQRIISKFNKQLAQLELTRQRHEAEIASTKKVIEDNFGTSFKVFE